MISAVKSAIKHSYGSEEYALIQAVNSMNEMNKSYNLIFERLSEWYGIYFPEARIINPSTLARLISLTASKDKLNLEDITDIVGGNDTADELYEKMSRDTGRVMEKEEKAVLLKYSKISMDIEEFRSSLEEYITSASNRLLPNTVYLTDNMVSAELLSKAGSLKRLVTMPASTIQLLGAEKALFKHIKFGSKPPKYGVLFHLPAISQARRDVRGKMARTYAAKIAIALKADIISKNFIGDELKKALDKSVERILKSPIPIRRPTKRKTGFRRRRK